MPGVAGPVPDDPASDWFRESLPSVVVGLPEETARRPIRLGFSREKRADDSEPEKGRDATDDHPLPTARGGVAAAAVALARVPAS